MPREITLELNGAPFLDRAEIATGMFDRMRGLLGRDSLAPRHGLLLLPCPSIHMMGMKFAIDVVFISRDGCVTRVAQNIPPWTFMVSGGKGAHAAIELAAGWMSADAVRIGDIFSWRETKRD